MNSETKMSFSEKDIEFLTYIEKYTDEKNTSKNNRIHQLFSTSHIII